MIEIYITFYFDLVFWSSVWNVHSFPLCCHILRFGHPWSISFTRPKVSHLDDICIHCAFLLEMCQNMKYE